MSSTAVSPTNGTILAEATISGGPTSPHGFSSVLTDCDPRIINGGLIMIHDTYSRGIGRTCMGRTLSIVSSVHGAVEVKVDPYATYAVAIVLLGDRRVELVAEQVLDIL